MITSTPLRESARESRLQRLGIRPEPLYAAAGSARTRLTRQRPEIQKPCVDARPPWRQRQRGGLWAGHTGLRAAHSACWRAWDWPPSVGAPPHPARRPSARPQEVLEQLATSALMKATQASGGGSTIRIASLFTSPSACFGLPLQHLDPLRSRRWVRADFAPQALQALWSIIVLIGTKSNSLTHARRGPYAFMGVSNGTPCLRARGSRCALLAALQHVLVDDHCWRSGRDDLQSHEPPHRFP